MGCGQPTESEKIPKSPRNRTRDGYPAATKPKCRDISLASTEREHAKILRAKREEANFEHVLFYRMSKVSTRCAGPGPPR
jgi:hypothetical protein